MTTDVAVYSATLFFFSAWKVNQPKPVFATESDEGRKEE
jgi:hypothetical protein